MTTRAARLTERITREKARLQRQRQQVADLEAQGREAARTARNYKRLQVGTAADEAGLFVWELETLVGLFAQLTRLKDTPDPVKVLEGLLSDDPASPFPCPDLPSDAGISERYP